MKDARGNILLSGFEISPLIRTANQRSSPPGCCGCCGKSSLHFSPPPCQSASTYITLSRTQPLNILCKVCHEGSSFVANTTEPHGLDPAQPSYTFTTLLLLQHILKQQQRSETSFDHQRCKVCGALIIEIKSCSWRVLHHPFPFFPTIGTSRFAHCCYPSHADI